MGVTIILRLLAFSAHSASFNTQFSGFGECVADHTATETAGKRAHNMENALIKPNSTGYSRKEGRPSPRCFKTVLAGFLAHGSSVYKPWLWVHQQRLLTADA